MLKATSLASRTAQRVEFAGFGPCYASGPRTIKAQCGDKIHTIVLTSDGTIEGVPPVLHYLHDPLVDPEMQAVMTVIQAVYVQHANVSLPLSDFARIRFVSDPNTRTTIDAVVFYLWLHDPVQNMRLVLTQVEFNGLPITHTTHLMPYELRADSTRWQRIGELFKRVSESTELATSMPSVLPGMLSECSLAAFERHSMEVQRP